MGDLLFDKIRICGNFVACSKLHTELGQQKIFKTSVLARFFNEAVGRVQKSSSTIEFKNRRGLGKLFTPASFSIFYVAQCLCEDHIKAF